jgi:hypothetical protein
VTCANSECHEWSSLYSLYEKYFHVNLSWCCQLLETCAFLEHLSRCLGASERVEDADGYAVCAARWSIVHTELSFVITPSLHSLLSIHSHGFPTIKLSFQTTPPAHQLQLPHHATSEESVPPHSNKPTTSGSVITGPWIAAASARISTCPRSSPLRLDSQVSPDGASRLPCTATRQWKMDG